MYTQINNTKKKLSQNLNNQTYTVPLMINDILQYKFELSNKTIIKNKQDKLPKLIVQFDSKLMDKISIPRIFNSKSVKDSWPIEIHHKYFKPKVFYKYDTPISLDIMNYKSFNKNKKQW